MKLKEEITREIEYMDIEQLLALYDFIKQLKRTGHKNIRHQNLKEIWKRTSISAGSWADDVATEREERG